MKYGPIDLADALGAVLAHSVRTPSGTVRKGVRLGAEEIARLAAAGLKTVVAAQLDAQDVPEDMAAGQVAAALAGGQVEVGPASTGRVNLYAQAAGLLCLDVVRVHAANRVHEAVTIATLLPDTTVEAEQMLATIKIIPYAVPTAALRDVLALLSAAIPALRVAPWGNTRVGFVMTRADDNSSAMLTKMRGAVADRIAPLGGKLVEEAVVAHHEAAVALALQHMLAAAAPPDMILVGGIAATVDRQDVVPAAIVQAGGEVLHAGMPVDPGNLLVLAQLPRLGMPPCPVVGIPTCARSPKLNGFDFVLRRLIAGESLTPADIMAMGVGGLLTEIETRPMPRDLRARAKGLS
jgi:molybdenum cofactor cytidylyltransferase